MNLKHLHFSSADKEKQTYGDIKTMGQKHGVCFGQMDLLTASFHLSLVPYK